MESTRNNVSNEENDKRWEEEERGTGGQRDWGPGWQKYEYNMQMGDK